MLETLRESATKDHYKFQGLTLNFSGALMLNITETLGRDGQSMNILKMIDICVYRKLKQTSISQFSGERTA